MFEAGLPPEGMQMITGFPADLGDELITSADVGLISFTGSAAAAKAIAAKAAPTLKRLAFELGGTDAMIVLDDADLDAAAEAVVQGRLTNGAGPDLLCGQAGVGPGQRLRRVPEKLLARWRPSRWATRRARRPTSVR